MNKEYITIYAIIPSEIYSTKKLTSEEKLIAERITALCKKEGYAWISNKALANIYGIREDTVSKHIKHLKEFGYIKCIYDKTNKIKSNRTIYLANNVWDDETIDTGLFKQEKIGYMSRHNNKRSNKYNYYKSKTIEPDWLFDDQTKNIKKFDYSNPEDIRQQKEMEELLSKYKDVPDEEKFNIYSSRSCNDTSF